MKSTEVIEAFELFNLDPDKATEEQVRKAYKAKAADAHPDRAGDGATEEMQKVNAAYEVALGYVEGRKPERCVCRGFTRNPLCRAHEEEAPESGVFCATCGGKRRVMTGPSWSQIEIDCPTCS